MYKTDIASTGAFGQCELYVNNTKIVEGTLDYVMGYGDAYLQYLSLDFTSHDWWDRTKNGARRREYAGL